MMARSEPTSQVLTFSSLVISLLPAGGGTRRRRMTAGLDAFFPIETYDVSIITIPVPPATALTNQDSSVALEDTQPPVFLNCPSAPIEVEADPGALAAVATWTGVAVVDNIASNLTLVGTHEPGSLFSVLGSPHTVIYLASDGKLEAMCTFEVHVDYPRTPAARTAETNGTFPLAIAQLPSRFVTRARHWLVGAGLPQHQTLPNLDLGTLNELRITLASPQGQPVAFRTRPNARKGQLVVKMAWAADDRNGSLPLPTEELDIGVRLAFSGFTLEDSNASASLADAELDQQLAPETQFRAAKAAVDPENGYIGIIEAYSLPFRRGFHFDTLSLVFQIPAGRSSRAAAPHDWRLLPGSGVYVEYDFDFMASPDAGALGGFVALLDTQPPVFSLCPRGPVLVNALPGEAFANPVWPAPQADDNSGMVMLSQTHFPGEEMPLRDPGAPRVRVTYLARDAFDNRAECSFEVEVQDVEPPTFTAPDVVRLALPPAFRSLVTSLPVEEVQPQNLADNSGRPVQIVSPLMDTTLPVGNHIVLVLVGDAYGNAASKNVSVIVEDNTPPVITCPPDLDVSAPADGSMEARVQFALPTVDDNDYDGGVDRVLALELSHPPDSIFPAGAETLVTALVRDPSNNQATCSFRIMVASALDRATGGGGDGQSTALGVGLGLGLGLLLLILLVAAFLFRRSKKGPQNWDEVFLAMEQFKDKTAGGEGGPVVPREIARHAVQLLEELGKGAFGVVWKALLKEEAKRPGYLVAVKSLHETCSATDKQELLEEAAIMAQFDSHFVAQLVGLVTVGAPMLMVVEYAEYGSLKSYLEEKEVDERLRLLWAGDVAEGMVHVHSKGFLHRDLATRNVLVGSDLRCKISDFGLAREVDENDTYYRSRGGQLPVRWTAPEALETRKFNERTDAWSFGVTLYELWTCAELPYKDWNNQRVWVEVSHGARLAQPQTCGTDVYRVMLACWAQEQQQRPEMTTLLLELRRLYAIHEGKPAPEPAAAVQAKAHAATAVNTTNAYTSPSPVNSQTSFIRLGYEDAGRANLYDYSDPVQRYNPSASQPNASSSGDVNEYDDAQMSPDVFQPDGNGGRRRSQPVPPRFSLASEDLGGLSRSGSIFYGAVRQPSLKASERDTDGGRDVQHHSHSSLPAEVYELAYLVDDGYRSSQSVADSGGRGGDGQAATASKGQPKATCEVLDLDWDQGDGTSDAFSGADGDVYSSSA
jgi:serine/threonine protein kinase